MNKAPRGGHCRARGTRCAAPAIPRTHGGFDAALAKGGMACHSCYSPDLPKTWAALARGQPAARDRDCPVTGALLAGELRRSAALSEHPRQAHEAESDWEGAVGSAVGRRSPSSPRSARRSSSRCVTRPSKSPARHGWDDLVDCWPTRRRPYPHRDHREENHRCARQTSSHWPRLPR